MRVEANSGSGSGGGTSGKISVRLTVGNTPIPTGINSNDINLAIAYLSSLNNITFAFKDSGIWSTVLSGNISISESSGQIYLTCTPAYIGYDIDVYYS